MLTARVDFMHKGTGLSFQSAL